MLGFILMILLIAIVVILIFSTVKIVPQSYAYVVERIGAYDRTLNVGLHILIPLIDRVSNRVLRPINAIETLTATTLRNIIGELELDDTLTSRDIINSKMRSILDDATDPWGIKVTRVEVKNILPPRDIQEAMEKQMRAERERREAILVAEGKIAKAEGQAEALRLVYEAQAKAIQYINEANPESAYIQLEGLKALKNLADGQATKIIVPNDLAGLAGTLSTLSESLKDPKKPE